ncbi:toll-like receptor 13 [Boleophthalmus pectinirostris]|uniref:toll-like receptor 13 n=1 Tax=Boleophthalmus pectinirostris TaxID=150288 RepID=UPI00242F9D82|nr:toll-like receptor 13 [Boleophthalmus pectinirostris]
MSRHSCSLLSLLFLLLLPRPSLFYFYFKISCEIGNNTVTCSGSGLNSIPPEIPKTATAVRITDSHIQSIKQTALTGLYKLNTLDLIHCNISHIEDEAFSDLSALTILMLDKNHLTLLTDNMFKGLSNLSSLSLTTNKITSISKSAFKPLNKLDTLDLSRNYLIQYSDIVHIYLHCPSLETLYLRFNKFTSFEANKLPLSVLKTLSLEGNNLTLFDTENSTFQFLTLRELNLDSTPLRRLSVHSDVFPHLKSLSLTNVSASVIEWDVSDKYFFRNLTHLNLKDTNFTIETYQLLFQMVDSVYNLNLENIGSFLFDKSLLDFACSIPSLTMLQLRFNHIAILNDSLLQSCSNLKRVDLSCNSMTDLTDTSLQMLTQLITLNLDENQLSRIPVAIRNLTTLKYLFLDSNHISELQCSDFTHLSLLTELSLHNNVISKLDSCFFQTLTNLNILDVSINHLVQLDGAFDGTLHKLKGLDVSRNNIVWLHKGIFRDMSSLTFLNLESIGVTSVEGGVFEGLYNLTDLFLSASSLQRYISRVTPAQTPDISHLLPNYMSALNY